MRSAPLLLSILLFSLGMIGFVTRKNILILLMCVELMLNAANLLFVTFSKYLGNLDGQVIVFFIMTIAAAEAAVGLGIVVMCFRTRNDLNADDFNLLKR